MLKKHLLIISRKGLYVPTKNGLNRLNGVNDLVKIFKSQKISALVGPSLSYLETVSVKNNQQAAVETELQKLLPTLIDHNFYDLIAKKNSAQTNEKFAFVLENSFFLEFRKVLTELNIELDSCESLALALADLTPWETPNLIIFVVGDLYFLLAKVGQNLETKTLESLSEITEGLPEFVTTLEEKYGEKISSFYTFSDRDLSRLKLETTELSLNFFKLKTSARILTKRWDQGEEIEGEIAPPVSSVKPPLSPKLLGLIVTLLLSLGALAFSLWLRTNQ